ncbi:hypothetical protein GUJ93_ZPchr0010g7751 [Zizania palustris]|uniref:Uncharacterized protein n=1 Tax=Zizania palustris TaxID=103762 RepID=A0A8J5W7V6_ZIZPA|nr:hypothetical protein GUJ93_ZPchr0010g7751 [Zizania palustris]
MARAKGVGIDGDRSPEVEQSRSSKKRATTLWKASFNFPKETAYHVRTLACSVARLDKGRILMEINYNACLWFN